MKYAYKTEIKPTAEQAKKIRRCMGICRWLYNRYITENQKLNRMYQRGLLDDSQPHFMSAIDFDKYVNNKLKVQPKYDFINLCGSKARKKAVVNAEMALKNFFKGKAYFPRFRHKNEQPVKLYFPKNNKSDWTIERHRLRVPTLGWVRLKEYGYLPSKLRIINGTISYRAGRYFVSVTVDLETKPLLLNQNIGIAVKLSYQEDPTVALLGKKIDKAQQILQRKYRLDKNSGSNKYKQLLQIQRQKQKLASLIRDDINKIVAEIVAHKPKSIAFPKLDKLTIDRHEYQSKYCYKYACRKLAGLKDRLEAKCLMLGIFFAEAEDIQISADVIIEIDI